MVANGAPRQARSPGGVEWIAFPRATSSRAGPAVGNAPGKGGEVVEHLRVGPMEVFHDNHDRPFRHAFSVSVAMSRLACRVWRAAVCHRIIEGPPIHRIAQIEEIMEEHDLLGLDDAGRDDTLDGDA